MKKLALIIAVYAAIIFVCCVLLASIFVKVPQLIEGTRRLYILLQGLLGFLYCLPGIFLSGFAVSCAVIWQKKADNSRMRFSAAMVKRYRLVVLSSIALIAILTFNEELFKPMTASQIQFMKNAPAELSKTLTHIRNLLAQEEPVLALQYAEKAIKLSPHDSHVQYVHRQTRNAFELARDRKLHRNVDNAKKIERPMRQQEQGYTILELLRMSDEAAESKNWFDAHYWAQLAVEACDGQNTNLENAIEKSNFAWKMLGEPVQFDNENDRSYYDMKKEGYEFFTRGDFLEAYYTFATLRFVYPRATKDPDVTRFFALAQEDVENQYFFFDEIQYIAEFSNNKSTYFSLTYPDGSKNVFHIANTMNVKRNGGLVQYLEDLYVVHYDETGNFVYSFHVPYAKAVAHPVSEFDEAVLLAMVNVEKKWEFVPVITLQAIDRESETIISSPEYSFDLTGLPQEVIQAEGLTDYSGARRQGDTIKIENTSMMVLPMPFADFNAINEATSGAESMSFLNLMHFLPRSSGYGFSHEVFLQNLLQRATFPFILLSMFVFCACVGWNYRLENAERIFRFSWVALIPVFGFLMVLAFSVGIYFFDMLNYAFIGMFQNQALFVAIAFYIVLFFIISLVFLARKA